MEIIQNNRQVEPKSEPQIAPEIDEEIEHDWSLLSGVVFMLAVALLTMMFYAYGSLFQ